MSKILLIGGSGYIGSRLQESLDVDGNIKFAERTFAAGEKEPSDGRWNTGSIVWNEKPSINHPVGWVCVKGGKPGSWRPFGLIQ